MKKLRNHLIGVDQGQVTLFSDFEDGGPMWTGQGPREVRKDVRFSEVYRSTPRVMVAISMWDLDRETNLRADLSADAITREGFTLVFRTWGDTRVARIRAAWTAIGELSHPDDWEID